MTLHGLVAYLPVFLTLVGIYGILSVGLNIQWGYVGQFNIGIAAFFAVGAYTSTILTTGPSPDYLGGFSLPFPAGLAVATIFAGILGFFVAVITARLRTDYLAIASIGIAEIIRLVLKNEMWMTNGVRGIAGIGKPFDSLPGDIPTLIYLAIVAVILLVVYLAAERLFRSPWGRVLRSIRENEPAAWAAGKNINRFRIEAFVLGTMAMGLAGALYAHFVGFISPEAFDPLFATFLVWVMLIAGGSGNNRGAILGAIVIWAVWAGTQMITNLVPPELITRASALRVFLIGLLLQVILLTRPEGLLPERPPRTVADEEQERDSGD